MARAESLVCVCPPAGMIDVVGKKWAMCIVTLLGRHGSLRFGKIHSALPRIGPATLVSTLRELERYRLVSRVPTSEDGRSHGEYQLTPEGAALYHSLLPFAQWLQSAIKWTSECVPEPTPPRRLARR